MMNRKNSMLVMFVAVMILSLGMVFSASAQSAATPVAVPAQSSYTVQKIWPPSHYLGTLREYMTDVQRLPGLMNEDICGKNEAEYKAHYQLLVKRINEVEWLMSEMDLRANMQMQRILNVFLRNKECGVGKIATGYADYAREQLNVQIEKAGLE